MSMYGVVLEYLRAHPNKTRQQIATAVGVPLSAVSDEVTILIRDLRVTDTAGSLAITTGRADK